jgi:hypothetical protein
MQQQAVRDSPVQRMIFNKLYRSNPQFRNFADSMAGQNPQQAFQSQGLDYNQFQSMDPNQVGQMLGRMFGI